MKVIKWIIGVAIVAFVIVVSLCITYNLKSDANKALFLGLCQIYGGVIAGLLTLGGVYYTIIKQKEQFEKNLESRGLELENEIKQNAEQVKELRRQNVQPILYISKDINGINHEFHYKCKNGDYRGNEAQFLCVLKNDGKGIAIINKFTNNGCEYLPEGSSAIVNLSERTKISFQLLQGASLNGQVFFSDIYDNQYVYDYCIGPKKIEELYNLKLV